MQQFLPTVVSAMGKAHYRIKSRVRCKAQDRYGRKGEVVELIPDGKKYRYKVKWEDGEKEIKAKRSLCTEEEFSRMKGKKMTRRPPSSSSSRGYSRDNDSSDEMESSRDSSSSSDDGSDEESDAHESKRYVEICACFDPILTLNTDDFLSFPHQRDSDSEESDYQDRSDVEEEKEDENDQLKPNGRPWTELECLNVDPALTTRFNHDARVVYNEVEGLVAHTERGPSFYFYHFFPMKAIPTMLAATNHLMKERHGVGTISKGELIKWFGVQLAMCIEPRRGGVDAYFDPMEKDGTTFTGANMAKRFQMSKRRYQKIKECLRFHTHEGEHDIGNVSSYV